MGKEILSKRQIAFLEVVGRSKDFTEKVYLTGGTALAAFYLNHRESEDLDFFSEAEIELLAVEIFLKSHKSELGFEKFEFQKSFNRNLFFLHFPEGVLKTEFTYFPFAPIEKGFYEGHLRIDSLRDIAANKVFTISQKPRGRDFVDLYFILKKEQWALKDLVQDARAKFDAHIDPIQFGAQLLAVYESKDWPRMLAPLDINELQSFFLQEAENLKKDVLK